MKIKKLRVDYKTPLKKQLEELGIKNFLDLDKIENLYPPSKDGYIYNVEDGKEMLDKSPEDCEKEFKKQGRRGLTIHEGLALLRKNPDVLKDHYIDLVGSRYERDFVPCLCFWFFRPWLSWGAAGDAYSGYGSASCESSFLPLESLSLECPYCKKELKIKVE